MQCSCGFVSIPPNGSHAAVIKIVPGLVIALGLWPHDARWHALMATLQSDGGFLSLPPNGKTLAELGATEELGARGAWPLTILLHALIRELFSRSSETLPNSLGILAGRAAAETLGLVTALGLGPLDAS